MSHVATQETKPGEPMFADMEALTLACEMLGLVIEHRTNYEWYNRHVGDYPVPAGVKVADLGNNAKFVVRLGDEAAKKYGSHGRKPYEIGMIEDPNNPGCFVPIYDFYMGGYGLESVVGRALFNDPAEKSVRMLCPRLKQHYDMCCDALAAKAAGDSIEFLTAQDAHAKYPQLFPVPPENADTWVSVANTDTRVATTL